MAIAGFFGQILWEDGEPAGFALALDLGGECEILSLGVVPGRRRAGSGSALLACDLRRNAAARRAQRLSRSRRRQCRGARALRGRGFVQIGRRLNYYRRPAGLADALVLRRAIARVSLST